MLTQTENLVSNATVLLGSQETLRRQPQGKEVSRCDVMVNTDCHVDKFYNLTACLRLFRLLVNLTVVRLPTLNIGGTIPWLQSQFAYEGESKMSTSINHSASGV